MQYIHTYINSQTLQRYEIQFYNCGEMKLMKILCFMKCVITDYQKKIAYWFVQCSFQIGDLVIKRHEFQKLSRTFKTPFITSFWMAV